MKILPITVVSVSDLDAEYPFTYLCRVLNKPRTDQPSYHTVKVMPPDYQMHRSAKFQAPPNAVDFL